MKDKVLVCGDRNWTDVDRIRKRLEWLYPGSLVITGDAAGADTIAHDVAVELGMETHVEMANWNRHGRAAGPLRNKAMLDMKPNVVIAFHDDLSRSKGTANCIKLAIHRGIPVEVIGKGGV